VDLEQAIERINELEEQIKRDTYCAFCGLKYPDYTPKFERKVLTNHIKICSKHPMRELEEVNEELVEALRIIILYIVHGPVEMISKVARDALAKAIK